jgi:hypothetical protein
MRKIIISIFILLLISCGKNENYRNDNLKQLVQKAKKTGFNVEYNETLNINKPDLKNITDPNLFGYSDGRLGDDAVLINKIKHLSKSRNDKIIKDSVPTAGVAIQIAEAIWKKKYGIYLIEDEKPYLAELKDSIWYITGSLPEGWNGGTAKAEISKKSGKILKIIHEQ